MKVKFKLLCVVILTFGLLVSNSSVRAEVEEDNLVELEKIVITPLKLEMGVDETSTSVTILDVKKLEQEGINTLKRALEDVSGLDISSSGSQTGATSVFIRGANNNHTSLIIDGVKLYDPIVTTSYYSFAHLSIDNIDRIEIARGPQSSLYGSDPIGGIISMITKKGSGKPEWRLSSQVGSFETFREDLAFSGQKDDFHFSLSASREDSDGFSAADESDGNDEEDGYQRTYSSWRFDYDLNKDITFGTTGRYTHSRYEYDDSGGTGGDDSDRKGWYDEGLLSAYLKQKLTDRWNYKLNLGWTRIYRKDKDRIGETIDDWYDGRTYQLNYQNNFDLSDNYKIVLGWDYLKEKGDSYYCGGGFVTDFSKKTTYTNGYFIGHTYNTDFGLNLSGSLRLEDHSTFDEHTTYKLGANYKFEKTGTRLKTTYGTGFNAPGLYQIYNSSSGNTNLNPEESESYDFGIEQELLDEKVAISSIYFHTHISDMIDYVSTGLWTGEYQNVGSVHIEGIENSIDYKIRENLKLKASYTHMRAIDNDADKRLLRRADNKFRIGLEYIPLKNWNIGLSLKYIGSRRDETGWPTKSVKLKSFTLVNVSSRYYLNETTEIFGRIDNLFDKDYELVDGYQTTPFSIHLGIRKTF